MAVDPEFAATRHIYLFLGEGGDFVAVAGIPAGTVHLIVDVVGWFE